MIHLTNYSKNGTNNKRRDALLSKPKKTQMTLKVIPTEQKVLEKVPEEVPVILPI